MKKFLLYFFGFILLMQLIRPTKNKSDVEYSTRIGATHPIPKNVENILKRACNDCHTNNTNYLWYHDVAPISWIVALDVYSGKTHLNFDEWDDYNIYQKTTLYGNFNKSITSGKMPTGIYAAYHPEAILSLEERKALTDWFTSIVDNETALE
jgi:hypothetical protein